MATRSGKKPHGKKSPRTSSKPKTGKRSRTISGNVLLVTGLKLLVVLALMTLSRFLFLLFNLSLLTPISAGEIGMAFLSGLRFDLSALLLLNLPFIVLNAIPFRFRYHTVYQRILNVYFYLVNALALMVNFIDTAYFPFTLKRMTADIFRYVGGLPEFSVLIPRILIDFWYILLFWMFFVGLMIWIGHRLSVSKPLNIKKPVLYYIWNGFLFVCVVPVVVIGIRGGLQLRPIGLVSAGKTASVQHVPLVLNTPFSIIRTASHPVLEKKVYFTTDRESARYFTPVHKAKQGGFTPRNVLIIILESFSMEHIGALNRHLDGGRYRGYTPVFDSLIRRGLFVYGFANEKTSITAVPAILSGIPSLMNDAFIQSVYSSNQYTSIAGLLRHKGYSSAFFHGATNGSMGFDQYTKYSGFESYFGRSEYNDETDFDGTWGIRDEAFLQFTAGKLDQLIKPFVAAVFTLSSHHPYTIPPKYRHIFQEGKLPIQPCIRYTDYALGEFLKTLRTYSWYNQTLVVITADHSSEAYYPFYNTNVGQYAIPLLFLFPDEEMKDTVSAVIGQQTDILPTIMAYLGYDRDFVAFGSDIRDRKAPHFSVHFNAGIYSLIKDDYCLEFDGNNPVALFRISQDSLQLNNLLDREPDTSEELTQFLKAYIQQYNNRMIQNRLMVQK